MRQILNINFVLKFSIFILFSIFLNGQTSNVNWIDLENTTVTINGQTTLTKTSGGNSWNGGAASQEVLPANTPGWIEVTASQTNTLRMFGFSTSNPNANYNSIGFAIYLTGGGVKIYENGSYKGLQSTYENNDVLRVERTLNGNIQYKKNGTLIYQSTATTQASLIGDVSIKSVGGTIYNAQFHIENSGGCSTTLYADTDSDGFGNPNSSIVDCTNPEGYVVDNTDCDDTDSAINPNTVWYQDSDADSFGNPAISQTQCEQPVGYVLDNTDCDDTTNDPTNNCSGGGPSVWMQTEGDIRYSDGKVFIGNEALDISSDDYNLFVEKGIMTERLKVAIEGSGDWADFVFKKGYKLITIDAMAEFIAEYGHLPGMPSAKEVADKGIDVAKMDAMLLQQIEESKLYIIQLSGKIKELEQKVQQLEK